MRVRDEMKMTIAAYQTLYKSSVAFGMRKQTEAEKGKDQLRQKLEQLKLQKEELLKKKNEILDKKFATESKIEEKRNYLR